VTYGRVSGFLKSMAQTISDILGAIFDNHEGGTKQTLDKIEKDVDSLESSVANIQASLKVIMAFFQITDPLPLSAEDQAALDAALKQTQQAAAQAEGISTTPPQ
jgi:hypothetical protein